MNNILQENTPTIFTERLILRKFTLSDLPHYYKIMSCKVTNKYLPWFPPKSESEALSLLRKNCLDTRSEERRVGKECRL